MWKCPNCETINKDDVCVVCGEKRVEKPKPEPMVEVIPNVQGQQVQQMQAPSETPFAEVIPPVSVPTNAVQPTVFNPTMENVRIPEKSSGKGKIVAIIFLVMIVLALVGGGVYLYIQNSQQADVGSIDSDIEKARELFDDMEYEECLEFLQNMKKSNSQYESSFDALYLEGYAYMELEKYNDASLCFEKALKAGESSECYINLAVCYAKVGKISEAEQVLAESKNDDEEKRYVQAEIAVIQDDTDSAIKGFEYVIANAEDENLKKRAYISLAGIYKNKRHIDTDSYYYVQKQTEVLEEAMRELKSEDDLTLTEMLAEVYHVAGKYDLAEIKFKRLLELGYDREYIYDNIAIVYLNSGQIEKAEEILLKMKEKYPESYKCYMRLAFVYSEMENKKAVEDRDYSSVVECYKLAKKYAGTKNRSEVEQLERALRDSGLIE